MTSYCQYTPDKKEQSTQNQTKICAIIVFYVYFVLYIELLFGDVGLNGSLNNVAPKGESVLCSSDGIVSLSIYNDSLYIKYNKDVSKDYYAELAISTSGMVLITNDSSGYHTKQIVNFQ